jgi:hypothetical protein
VATRTVSSRTNFRQLDERQIVETLVQLRDAIEERFPSSGLGRVSGELLVVAREASEIVDYLKRPHWLVRLSIGVAIVAMLVVLGMVVTTVRVPARVEGLTDFVQAVESGINDLIFLGIAIFFLVGIESRLKRKRALTALHELRSLVHIIDMHQLTKDPERLLAAQRDGAAAERAMTAAELGRYLDFCSDLLSVSSKVAALFVQHFNDSVVLGAVDEIETLSGGFSSKIWQKITLLERSTSAR